MKKQIHFMFFSLVLLLVVQVYNSCDGDFMHGVNATGYVYGNVYPVAEVEGKTVTKESLSIGTLGSTSLSHKRMRRLGLTNRPN